MFDNCFLVIFPRTIYDLRGVVNHKVRPWKVFHGPLFDCLTKEMINDYYIEVIFVGIVDVVVVISYYAPW